MTPAPQRRIPLWAIVIGATVLFAACSVCGVAGLWVALTPRTTALDVGTPARINGLDSQGNRIDPINVWRDYEDRSAGVVATVRDNELVMVLKRTDEAAQIRVDGGAVGWVGRAFIR